MDYSSLSDEDFLKDSNPYSQLSDDEFLNQKPAPVKPTTSLAQRAGDVGITALKSAIGVPEAALGLADIVTGGRAGKTAESFGFRPKEAKAFLEEQYSPAQQEANRTVRETKGFLPTLQAYAQNPSVLAHDIGEQAFPILAGGLAGAGVRTIAPKLPSYVPGAVGETILTAGQNVEQARQESPTGLLTAGQIGPLAASAAITGSIAGVGGKLAQRAGLTDIENIISGGTARPTVGPVKNILGTTAIEAAEEGLQSPQEQVASNIALNRPLLEGVPEATAQGLLLGGAMGGGAAIANNFGPLTRAASRGITNEQRDRTEIAGTQPISVQPGNAVLNAGQTGEQQVNEQELADTLVRNEITENPQAKPKQATDNATNQLNNLNHETQSEDQSVGRTGNGAEGRAGPDGSETGTGNLAQAGIQVAAQRSPDVSQTSEPVAGTDEGTNQGNERKSSAIQRRIDALNQVDEQGQPIVKDEAARKTLDNNIKVLSALKSEDPEKINQAILNAEKREQKRKITLPETANEDKIAEETQRLGTEGQRVLAGNEIEGQPVEVADERRDSQILSDGVRSGNESRGNDSRNKSDTDQDVSRNGESILSENVLFEQRSPLADNINEADNRGIEDQSISTNIGVGNSNKYVSRQFESDQSDYGNDEANLLENILPKKRPPLADNLEADNVNREAPIDREAEGTAREIREGIRGPGTDGSLERTSEPGSRRDLPQPTGQIDEKQDANERNADEETGKGQEKSLLTEQFDSLSSEGLPLRKVEGNTYVDHYGEEVQDDYAVQAKPEEIKQSIDRLINEQRSERLDKGILLGTGVFSERNDDRDTTGAKPGTGSEGLRRVPNETSRKEGSLEGSLGSVGKNVNEQSIDRLKNQDLEQTATPRTEGIPSSAASERADVQNGGLSNTELQDVVTQELKTDQATQPEAQDPNQLAERAALPVEQAQAEPVKEAKPFVAKSGVSEFTPKTADTLLKTLPGYEKKPLENGKAHLVEKLSEEKAPDNLQNTSDLGVNGELSGKNETVKLDQRPDVIINQRTNEPFKTRSEALKALSSKTAYTEATPKTHAIEPAPNGNGFVLAPKEQTVNPSEQLIAREKVSISSIDTPIQSNLATLKIAKTNAYKEIKRLQDKLKSTPLGGGRQAVQLEIIKAKDKHSQIIQSESNIKNQIEKRANELGQTILKPQEQQIEQTNQQTETAPQRKAAAAQAGTVNNDRIKQALLDNKIIGQGGNAKVYDINGTDYVLRVENTSNKKVNQKFEPVEDPFEGRNFGQAIAKQNGMKVLRRQNGTPAGLTNYGKDKAKNNTDYLNSVKSAAVMPQEAYDKFADDLNYLSSKGYQFDPSKSNNVLISPEENKFNLVDINKGNYKSTAEDMLITLMGNTYAWQYEGKDIKPFYKEIYKKVMIAAKKHGLATKLGPSGEYSVKLANEENINAPPKSSKILQQTTKQREAETGTINEIRTQGEPVSSEGITQTSNEKNDEIESQNNEKTIQPNGLQSQILTQPKKQYLLDQKRTWLKEHKNALPQAKEKAFKDLETEYETEVERAHASLPFEQYKALPENKGQPEGVLRQAHEQLQSEYGGHLINKASKPEAIESKAISKYEKILKAPSKVPGYEHKSKSDAIKLLNGYGWKFTTDHIPDDKARKNDEILAKQIESAYIGMQQSGIPARSEKMRQLENAYSDGTLDAIKKRLAENNYKKTKYYANPDGSNSSYEISKQEYDYAQELAQKTPESIQVVDEVSKKGEKLDNIVESVKVEQNQGEAVAGSIAKNDIGYNEVVRFDEEGDNPIFEKPHGIYTTPVNVESPHQDVGSKKTIWRLNPSSNVLKLEVTDGKALAMRKNAVGAGAGVAAARELLGSEIFNNIKSLSKSSLIQWIANNANIKGINFEQYHDAQEVMEVLGAQLAKQSGYDSISYKDRTPFWGSPEFDEHVLLTENSVIHEGEAKFSQSQQSTGTTKAELTSWLDANDKKLLRSGKLNVVQSVSDLPAHLISTGNKQAESLSGFSSKIESSRVENPSNGIHAKANGIGNTSSIQSRVKQLNDFFDRVIPFEPTNVPASSLKDTRDGWSTNAKLLGDIAVSPAFIKKGFSGIDIPTRRMVLKIMRLAINDDKIGNGIVESISVDMMNLLGGKNLSSQMFFHDKSMLKDSLPINNKPSIPVRVNMAITELALSVADHTAIAFDSSNIALLPSERFAAMIADKGYKGLFSSESASTGERTKGVFGLLEPAFDSFNSGATSGTIDDRHVADSEKVGNVLGGKGAETSLSPSIISRLAGVEALYDGKTKSIYLVSDNLTRSTLTGVILHEKLHAAIAENPKLKERLLGAQSELNDIFKQVESGKYTGRYKDLYDAAMKRVDRAKTNPQDRFEEWLAYQVSEHSKAPQSVPERLAKAIANLVAAIRAAIYKFSGKIDNIGPSELSALARASMNISVTPTSSNVIDSPNLLASRNVKQSTDNSKAVGQQEYDDTRAKYFDTKDWMKAPNGKPTNLNEVQWVQTRTPSFKKWFGDWINDPKNASKVVDENGEPLVVYHNSDEEFFEFRKAYDLAVELARKEGFDENFIKKRYDIIKDEPETHFFAEEEETAESYGGDFTREFFLNIRSNTVGNDNIDAIKEMVGNNADGALIENETTTSGRYGGRAWIVRSSNQIKSATGNTGAFSPESNDIRYSIRDDVRSLLEDKKTIIGDSQRSYEDDQREAFRVIGREITEESILTRLKEMRKDLGKRWIQGTFDQFSPIKEITEKGYMLSRLSKGSTGAFEVFMRYGKLKIDSQGAYNADTTGGVINNVFAPIGKETHDFLYWVAANRAEQLMAEERENLFTEDHIKSLKRLNQGETDFNYTLPNGTKTKNRNLIYNDTLKKFNEFNKNALDMAEQSGLIDGESRQLWEKEFYVPFYRVMDEEEGGARGFNIKQGIIRQEAFKKLKGGEQKLNSDLLENTLMNWAHLLDASAKNRAAKETLEAAERLGAARKALPGEKNTVWFKDNGSKQEYKVDDPYLLTAISALEYAGIKGGVMDVMSSFKHMLTIGVTASPFYKVRNLIRDSVHSVAVANMSYNIPKNVKLGWDLTARENQEFISALAGGGMIRFGTMLEGSESKRTQQLIKLGNKEASILNNENKVRAFYDTKLEPLISAYNEIGNRGEEINRISLYDQLIKQGKSHLEASFEARDMMDFSSQGTFIALRILTQVVPFMNSRLQGIYRLGKAYNQDKMRLGTVIGVASLASLALLAAYSDDDDWKKREDWDRDNYWWFKFGGEAFRIPKPFEIGVVTTLAERTAELIFDKEMTGDLYRQRLGALLGSQLSLNPIPQVAKPIIDLYANKDSFTGRPIESMSMERLEPSYRYRSNTSLISRGLSTTGNQLTGDRFLSPVQIDHLIRAYFSWLGGFVVGGADMAVRSASDEPTRPSLDMFKFITGNMVANTKGAPSKYVSRMYDQAKVLEQAYGTYRQLIKEGKIQEAQEFRSERHDDLIKYKQVSRVKNRESKINEKIRAIERSTLTPQIKKQRIDDLKEQQDRIAREIQ